MQEQDVYVVSWEDSLSVFTTLEVAIATIQESFSRCKYTLKKTIVTSTITIVEVVVEEGKSYLFKIHKLPVIPFVDHL